MDDELLIYSGGGDIKIKENKGDTEIEKKKKRLKERTRVFTEELKRLEQLEKDAKKSYL